MLLRDAVNDVAEWDGGNAVEESKKSKPCVRSNLEISMQCMFSSTDFPSYTWNSGVLAFFYITGQLQCFYSVPCILTSNALLSPG
jgi:hypothetical protein